MMLSKKSNKIHISLRPVQMEDAPAIQKLATSHPDIVKQTRLPDPYPKDGAEQWIQQHAVPRHKEGKEYSFVIQNQKKQIVGVCGLIVNQERDEAELGYWIGEPFWKKGYATAAIRDALRFAFEKRSFQRVFALPLDDNIGSKRALEKNGFHFVENRLDDEQGCNTGGTLAVYEIWSKNWK